MLKASNLTYKPIINGLELSLEPGEMVGLIGGNGSGKSTLLRLLSGLLPLQAGQIEIDGVLSHSNEFNSHCRNSLGLVFQNPESQLVANTVDEEVAFGPGQLGLSRSQLQERVDWALHQVGLEERRHWQSHALSTGQKQRLALAAVLAMRPRYLLLDEPTSMLDPQARNELMHYLAGLKDQVGILLVTHRSEELKDCQRILHLHQGQIVNQVSSSYLWQNPAGFAELQLSIPSQLQLESLLRKSIPHQPFTIKDNTQSDYFADFQKLQYCYARGTPLCHLALQNITCSFPMQSRSALIGQTGSGKSTLLQHLNLLLRPQSGQLHLFGQKITDRSQARPLRQRVGMLFQQPETQFFQATVWDEVAYAPANFGLEVDNNTRRALALVDLPAEQYARRNPFHLSGGEQRRLALACSLAYQPQALVLDEPGAGLDLRHRHNLWQLLYELPLSLIIISHDLEEVGQLAQHIVWLESGQVKSQGRSEDIFRLLGPAGFELPAWSNWALQNFPSSPIPVNQQQFKDWQLACSCDNQTNL